MRAVECSKERAAALLLPVLASKPNPGARVDMAEILDGRCYVVTDSTGHEIGAYVLRGRGAEIWVQAAAGKAGVDLCDVYADLIPKHGIGFETVGFRTYRRGLVKKALQRGYEIVGDSDGFIMRKKI